MNSLKSVEELCKEHGLAVHQLAERAGLDEKRMLAIVSGRWTPARRNGSSGRGIRSHTRPDCVGPPRGVDTMYGHGPQFLGAVRNSEVRGQTMEAKPQRYRWACSVRWRSTGWAAR